MAAIVGTEGDTRRQDACLAMLLELMVACGNQRPAADPGTGLVRGEVRAGPITPLARPGVPATRPLPGATIEALRADDVVATAHTATDGEYQLSLPPGTYLIRVRTGRYLARKSDRTITVAAGEMHTVTFTLDTGIR